MKADTKNKTIHWVAFDNDLLNCLKQKDNHKYSRYDAFVWLVEQIKKGHLVEDDSGKECLRQEFVSNYCRLAEYWCWTRQTVQKFIEDLSKLKVISQRQFGNYYVFTLNSTSANKIIL